MSPGKESGIPHEHGLGLGWFSKLILILRIAGLDDVMGDRVSKTLFVLLMIVWTIQVVGQLIFLLTAEAQGSRLVLTWVLLLVAVVCMVITVRWRMKKPLPA